ncbi:MAG: HEPN domain-containing protein [Spirochaetota bacterium]
MDLHKQINYWLEGSQSDIETAEILIQKNKLPEGMFFCHLSIEKILKAIFVQSTENLAPKSHNLFMLAEKAGIELSQDRETFYGILMKYQIEGRYPEHSVREEDKGKIAGFLSRTKEELEWLKKML